MKTAERRFATRVNLKIPLRFRPITNRTVPEQKAESMNLSQNGAYFVTDYPLLVGTPVELFLKMPRELTGQPATEMRCTARVIHIRPEAAEDHKLGVGVHIERYDPIATEGRWAT